MFRRTVQAICRSAARSPYLWLLVTLLPSLPALHQVRKIGLDTDLTRLLPENSRAVRWNRELQASTGDGGYFSVLFEGDDPARLLDAVQQMASQVEKLPEIQSVDYRNPVDFVQTFRYLLLPSEVLQRLFDTLVRWKDEASPFGLKLEERAGTEGASGAGGVDDEEVETALERYGEMTEYHQSQDGRIHGMIVRAKKGLTNLAATRRLFYTLQQMAEEVGRQHRVWAGIGGTLRNKVDVFDQIRSDLKRSGMIAGIGILLTLIVTLRSVRVLPVVLYPLSVGLLWSYGLVPSLVGDLNTITSFLLMVLLGMGVEYALHLVSRFQSELVTENVEQALEATFLSTGRSILTSGFTTAFGMAILIFSSFRGFSEFGVISGVAMLTIFLAMFLVLPPTLAAGHRLGLVRPRRLEEKGLSLVPPGWATAVAGALVLGATIGMAGWLSFDYDFSNLQAEVPSSELVKSKHRQVYRGGLSPAALYVARDLDVLDESLAILGRHAEEHPDDGQVGRRSSVREFVPDAAEAEKRRSLLIELQDRLQGRWVRRVKDEDRRRWIDDLRDFKPPAHPTTLEDLPPQLERGLQAFDGSGELLLSVYTKGERKNGVIAMSFTRALYDLPLPEGLRGPTGETPVFAEILWLVTREGPWLVGLTLLGIFVLVLLDRGGSVPQAAWIMLPLVGGLTMTLGWMSIVGWKLNFFNIVVIPNLLGNTVDNGVHYYRRWRELNHDTRAVQHEMLVPVSGSAVTAIMGYLGMVFAHHAGLRSIGNLAVLGLACCWFTGVVLMPGLLRLRERSLARRDRGPRTPEARSQHEPAAKA